MVSGPNPKPNKLFLVDLHARPGALPPGRVPSLLPGPLPYTPALRWGDKFAYRTHHSAPQSLSSVSDQRRFGGGTSEQEKRILSSEE